jgi:hypothetical protein
LRGWSGLSHSGDHADDAASQQRRCEYFTPATVRISGIGCALQQHMRRAHQIRDPKPVIPAKAGIQTAAVHKQEQKAGFPLSRE